MLGCAGLHQHRTGGRGCIISPPCAANRPQVQDTLDPEYYLGAARLADGSWATTKFSDAGPAAPPPAEEDMKVNS
jgi:hypothetical protein